MPSVSNRTVARYSLVVIGLVIATLLVLTLAYETRRILTWIVIAVFFAVALHPVVSWLENRARWIKRWLATLLVYLLTVLFIAGLVTLFVLPLVREAGQLADDLPRLIDDFRAGRGPVGSLASRFHVIEYIQSHSDQLRSYLTGLGAPTLSALRTAATGVAGIVTIFVLSYLMVVEAPRVIRGFLSLFNEEHAARISRVSQDCGRTVTGYISGNLLISVIAGLLAYAALALLHVPFAGLIALFVAIADLIPLVGATLGAVVAVLAGFSQSITAGIILIIFFIVYQQLENHLLQPFIFSRTVQLNPLTVLVAILLAVEVAGILGALLAIPVAGIIQIVARDIWDTRKGRLKASPTVGPDEKPATGGPGGNGEPGGNGGPAENPANGGPGETPAVSGEDRTPRGTP
jgi:predicted PurR-regulated permease PerM